MEKPVCSHCSSNTTDCVFPIHSSKLFAIDSSVSISKAITDITLLQTEYLRYYISKKGSINKSESFNPVYVNVWGEMLPALFAKHKLARLIAYAYSSFMLWQNYDPNEAAFTELQLEDGQVLNLFDEANKMLSLLLTTMGSFGSSEDLAIDSLAVYQLSSNMLNHIMSMHPSPPIRLFQFVREGTPLDMISMINTFRSEKAHLHFPRLEQSPYWGGLDPIHIEKYPLPGPGPHSVPILTHLKMYIEQHCGEEKNNYLKDVEFLEKQVLKSIVCGHFHPLFQIIDVSSGILPALTFTLSRCTNNDYFGLKIMFYMSALNSISGFKSWPGVFGHGIWDQYIRDYAEHYGDRDQSDMKLFSIVSSGFSIDIGDAAKWLELTL